MVVSNWRHSKLISAAANNDQKNGEWTLLRVNFPDNISAVTSYGMLMSNEVQYAKSTLFWSNVEKSYEIFFAIYSFRQFDNILKYLQQGKKVDSAKYSALTCTVQCIYSP